ncbi:MAG: PEP-CTERM sorting domain-containing protein [Tepidisphaeraceae bacterium]
MTAVTFSANPGTGLTRINEADARWLQAQGRLSNGAEFATSTRSADTGQRIVAALNTGLDPSWSVGENDDGNTTTNAANQRNVGPGFRLSGKTSGSEARNAIAQSRLGFGALSLAETRAAASGAPIRALDVAFGYEADPTSGGSVDASKFIRVNFDSIANFTVKTVLISHYNTIKKPRPDLLAAYQAANPGATAEQIQTWWNNLSSDETQGGTGIKGDTTGAARAVINNVGASIGTAAAGLNASTIANPADGLFINGFLIPQLLNYKREYDGGPLTSTALNAQQLALQQDVKSNYGQFFTPDGTSGSNSQTIGGVGTKYGALGTSTAFLGDILISAKDVSGNAVANGVLAPKGNYLFGNFNQDGKRDFKSVKESVNAALSLHAAERLALPANVTGTPDNSAFRGVTNSTAIGSLSGTTAWSGTAGTKGDLIVLGDFNTDGAFDGKDVYLLARGASLSDNASTDQLTTASGATFADQMRNPNARLNKNAALDYAQAATANTADVDQAFLRQTARATLTGTSLPVGATQISTSGSVITYTFDPAGANAFNKLDVNRDGRVTRDDAAIVDYFVGQTYHDFEQSALAVVRTDINPGGTPFANGIAPLDATDAANAVIPRRQIGLVDVELTDNAVITSIGNASASDLNLIASSLISGGKLLTGDANFDGTVNFTDLLVLAANYGKTDASLGGGTAGFTAKWSTADGNFDGTVNFGDLLNLAANYNGSVSGSFAGDWALAQSLVPEPASLGMLFIAGVTALRRRRRD